MEKKKYPVIRLWESRSKTGSNISPGSNSTKCTSTSRKKASKGLKSSSTWSLTSTLKGWVSFLFGDNLVDRDILIQISVENGLFAGIIYVCTHNNDYFTPMVKIFSEYVKKTGKGQTQTPETENIGYVLLWFLRNTF